MLDKKEPQSNPDDAALKDFLDTISDLSACNLPAPRASRQAGAQAGRRAVPHLNGNSLNAVFRAAGSRYALSPALLKAVGKVLSGLKADAVSPRGKLGLMQLTSDVARLLRLRDPFDPVESIFGGARYLRLLLDRNGGDLRLALAAYFNSEEAGAAAEAPFSRETQVFIDLVYAAAAAYAGRKEKEQKGEVFADLAGLLKNGGTGMKPSPATEESKHHPAAVPKPLPDSGKRL